MKPLRADRLVLAAGLSFAFLLCLGPISNPDLPWHLAVARRIVAERAVPRADFLSWTMEGKAWVDFEWLTQLVYHAAHSLAGAAGLWGVKVASFAALGAGVAAVFALWGLSGSWIGLCTFAVFLALRPFIQLRPENVSLILFVLQLIVLEARRLGRPLPSERALLAGHAAAYALWANMHAGFPMGLLLCACYRSFGWAAAGAAGTLLNPYGAGVWRVLWEHGRDMEVLRSLITEWAAPSMGGEYTAGYWILFAFGVGGFVAAVATGVPVPAEHVLAALAFGLGGSRSLRTTAYVTLAVFPLGVLAWSRVAAPRPWVRARPAVLAAAALFAAWNAAVLMKRNGFLREIKPPSRAEIRSATQFLRDEKAVLSPLRMFNAYDWGGFIDDELYPDYRVFMDGRYLFAGLLNEVHEAERSPTLWSKFVDDRGIDLALMTNTGRIVSFRGQTSWRAFDVYAMPPARWALVYWDSQALVFVRRSRVPAEWIASREFSVVRPHDLRQTGLRVLSGWLKIEDVEKEIARYEREIGDPYETAIMRDWLAKFKKGLVPGADARKPTPPRSRRPGAPTL